MKVPVSWLNEYLKVRHEVRELAQIMTFAGIEVEDIVRLPELPPGVIAVKIIECRLMDDSDYLQICQCDTGSEILQAICGAPNCRAGIISAFALPGTNLGDTQIKETHIRGFVSSGMLCSEKELGISDEHRGIIELPLDTRLGINLNELLNLPDTVLELEITPNRPDLLGIIGIIKDLSAVTGEEIKIRGDIPIGDIESTTEKIHNYLKLTNRETELCPRYTARVFRNVRVAESPFWLKQHLIRAGLRPINNVVDITNYVMLEYGHPLHAFDYDKLEGISDNPEIIIRKAMTGEEFPALDGNKYLLTEDDLVIADGKKAIAIAGVIGGENSHITEQTANVVLEAANFNYKSIRRTSTNLKISTDSSYRFERHLTDETAETASCRAAELIVELCGADLCEGVLDDWSSPQPNRVIPLRPSRFREVIGLELPESRIIQYLQRLGLKQVGYSEWKKTQDIQPNQLNQSKIHDTEVPYIEIPHKRIDLEREIDLIEEVIRLHGYANIPQREVSSMIMDRYVFSSRRRITDYFAANGFQEVVNLSFFEPEALTKLSLTESDERFYYSALRNPQSSNQAAMRTSLLPQLLQNAAMNLNNGEDELRLFEINKVFLENNSLPKAESYRLTALVMGRNAPLHWKYKPQQIDFFWIKGIVEGLMQLLGLQDIMQGNDFSPCFVNTESQSISSEGTKLAEFGMLKPEIAAAFELDVVELKQNIWIIDLDVAQIINLSRNTAHQYKPFSRYPSVKRDLSFLINQDISFSDIKEVLSNLTIPDIQSFNVADEYRGRQIPDGFRSVCLRIVFNRKEKTLTDNEVDALFEKVVNALKLNYTIEVR